MADTLSQALLEASLLASLPEEDEGSVIIDVDRRTMVLPTGFFFGVYNDKDILKVPFVIPRYYNELDLSEFQITVNYINSAGYGNIYRVTDAEVTDSAIHFKWVTGRGVFVKEGTVRFIVCLRQIGSNGEVEKEFNTTIASANVLKGLEVDENPDPVAYSILAHMEELKDQAEAAVEVVEGAADRIDDAVTEAEQAIAAMYHSPYIAPTAAGMLSHDKVYVYTGNETGYTFGNWYYWNGSAFVSGGVYNATAFNTDDTLSISGAAADAKKTGDEIASLKQEIGSIDGISDELKEAFLACFLNVAWSGANGRSLYNNLYNVLYGPSPKVLPDLSIGEWETGHGWAADGSESNSNYLVVNRTYYTVESETEYTWVQGFSSYMQGSTYGQTGVGEVNQYQVCFYDENKNFIERITNQDYTTDITYVEQRYFGFTTPSDAAFIRVACRRWPVGFFAESMPSNIYSVVVVYGKTDDSDFVSGDMPNVQSSIRVLRNGEDITMFAKTGSKLAQTLTETYQLGRCVFDINSGANAEGGPATSVKNRYTLVKNMLLQDGDTIAVNELKVMVWAQKLVGGAIQHTTTWLTTGSTFTIGG